MKILVLNTERSWRGGERQTLYQLEGYREAGLDASLLCLAGSPLQKRGRELGLSVLTVPSQLTALSFLAIRGRLFDIIHAETGRTQSMAVVTKFLHHCPVVYTRRVDFVPNGIFTLWKYRKTDRLIAISHAIAMILREKDLGKVDVIPSVVRPYKQNRERIAELKKQYAPNGETIIGTVSALVEHKDPLTMVRAFKEVHNKRDNKVFLHFGEGSLRKKVESLVMELDLESVYHLPGHVDDIEEILPLLEVFTMSSQEEGLGSTVLDAFLAECPVATTDAGGLKETVEGRGMLSPVHSSEGLANNILAILENGALDKQHRREVHKEIVELYSIKISTAKQVAIFKEILKEELPV